MVRVQTWTSITAVLISVPGLWLALLALRDQRDATRRAAISTHQETQRFEQRFASRLAWRDAPWSPDAGLLTIQNRSMSTLTSLIVINHGRAIALLPGDMPPCSSLDIDVVGAFGLNPFGEPAWTTEAIIFHDPVGAWIMDRSGLRKLSEDALISLVTVADSMRTTEISVVVLSSAGQVLRVGMLQSRFLHRNTVGDCSEG
jgi:hypothetical protein